MDKKSKVLILVFVLALVVALGYSYYRYVSTGDFLIDETQVEPEEPAEAEAIDEMTEEMVPDSGNSMESPETEVESGA